MKCNDIITVLEDLAPVKLACSWDNPGLQVGRLKKDVKKIYVALDATDEVIEDAVNTGADMLITHHPLIFTPLKHINDSDFVGRRLMELISHDISYYAMHTNYDSSSGGMAYAAGKRLGMKNTKPLEVTYTDGENSYGVGIIGEMNKAYTIKTLAKHVKDVFDLPDITLYGKEFLDKKIRIVALCPGSGKSVLGCAVEGGADVIITGDIGHHEGIDSVAENMAVIDAGHYGIEHIFTDEIASYLEARAKGKIKIIKAEFDLPSIVI